RRAATARMRPRRYRPVRLWEGESPPGGIGCGPGCGGGVGGGQKWVMHWARPSCTAVAVAKTTASRTRVNAALVQPTTAPDGDETPKPQQPGCCNPHPNIGVAHSNGK